MVNTAEIRLPYVRTLRGQKVDTMKILSDASL